MLFNGTSGTNSLNFKVIASATEPSNSKENTIWCKTSVPISYLFIDGVTWVPTWEAGIGAVYLGYEAGVGSPGADNALLHIVKLRGNMQEFLAKLTACHQNQDGTASGWKSLDAYIYKSGNWVQFSSAFTAGINISYPAGSILTCTDGSTTLTAGNTTGSWYFTIPNAGNWTVTATSGSNSASQTVAITADGQVEQVVLSYTTYLYNKGWVGVATSLTAVSADQTGNINGADKANIVITYVDECIKLYRGSYDGSAWAYTDVEIDLTNVDTIFCKTLSASSNDSILFGAGKTNSLRPEASVALVAKTLQSVDVSSLSGSYRIGFWGAASGYTPWAANHMIEAFGLGTGS